jgi:hypothetical protein
MTNNYRYKLGRGGEENRRVTLQAQLYADEPEAAQYRLTYHGEPLPVRLTLNRRNHGGIYSAPEVSIAFIQPSRSGAEQSALV